MLKIELSNLQFHAFHGVYEEESRTGADFEVDLMVEFEPEKFPVLHLQETIDYTKLYDIIKRRMDKRTSLIETVATEIAQEIFDLFMVVDTVLVKVKKLNPPIPFFNGNVSVEYILKRDERK